MLKFKFVLSLLLLWCVVFFCPTADAYTLSYNDANELTGISGILVGDTIYDVEFVEGAPEDLYAAGLTFTSQSDATIASTALLDVLDDEGYLTHMEDILGLDTNSKGWYEILTAYDMSKQWAISTYETCHSQGVKVTNSGSASIYNDYRFRDYLSSESYDYAVFTQWTVSGSISSAPEPCTIFLLGIGLLGLAGLNRKKYSKLTAADRLERLSACPQQTMKVA